MLKCLHTSNLPDSPQWADTLSLAAALNCTALELCLAQPHLAQLAHADTPSAPWQDTLDALARDSLTVAALTTDSFDLFSLAQPDREDRDRALDLCRELLSLASRCPEPPCVIINAHTLHCPDQPPAQPLGQPYEQAFNTLFDSLGVLADHAADLSVTLAFENPACALLLSPLEVRDVIDHLNNPYVALCLNPRHAQCLYDPLDLLNLLDRRLAAVHLPLPPADQHPPQLSSGRPFAPIIVALQSLSLAGPIIYCASSPWTSQTRHCGWCH